MKNLFEIATRKKFRFSSVRGDLTVEQLWDLPTTSKIGFDLDTIARAVNKELKAQEEESFVKTSRNTVAPVLTVKLEILKHIIQVKLEENEAALARVAKQQTKDKILSALEAAEDRELSSKSKDELLAELRALGV